MFDTFTKIGIWIADNILKHIPMLEKKRKKTLIFELFRMLNEIYQSGSIIIQKIEQISPVIRMDQTRYQNTLHFIYYKVDEQILRIQKIARMITEQLRDYLKLHDEKLYKSLIRKLTGKGNRLWAIQDKISEVFKKVSNEEINFVNLDYILKDTLNIEDISTNNLENIEQYLSQAKDNLDLINSLKDKYGEIIKDNFEKEDYIHFLINI